MTLILQVLIHNGSEMQPKWQVKFDSLSKEDGEPLSQLDLAPKAQLLMDHKGKSYPCTVTKVESLLIESQDGG